jgi:hypothetical protein
MPDALSLGLIHYPWVGPRAGGGQLKKILRPLGFTPPAIHSIVGQYNDIPSPYTKVKKIPRQFPGINTVKTVCKVILFSSNKLLFMELRVYFIIG